MSDTRISVRGGVLVTGIPRTPEKAARPLGLVERSVSVGVGSVGLAVCGTCVAGGAAGDWCGPAGRA